MKKLWCAALLMTSTLAWAGLSDGNTGMSFGSPGVVPHSIGAFVPITQQDNMCVSCHADLTKTNPESHAAIPPSHMSGEKLDERRYVCTLCHAPAHTPEK